MVGLKNAKAYGYEQRCPASIYFASTECDTHLPFRGGSAKWALGTHIGAFSTDPAVLPGP
jgi:hypothetical protein